jgi:hypothetical protein
MVNQVQKLDTSEVFNKLTPSPLMLFILMMDVLNSLFSKAGDLELLQPLSRGSPSQRIPLYADDVVLFTWPQEAEMNLTVSILDKFGEASGLQTNL